MKTYFYTILFVYFLLFTSQNIQSQERISKKIDSKYAYAEKIYLQLSSTIYTTDNTIWFKAVVTDLTHVPTKLSRVLHVELIDFDKRIIDKKLLKLEHGIADSFFDLDEDMPAGRYQIRAYTEWNKNFDDAFISQTYINIYEPKKVLENEAPIRGVTLTESAPNQFTLSAKAYPKLLNSKYKGRLKMYVHTETKTDSVEIKRGKENDYSFEYQLPKDVIKARIELKLDSVKLRNNNKGFISSYSKTVAVNKAYLDLQFFPEGGKLVDGLTSKVAFKALDYKNEGTVVKGYVVDQDNNIITPFRSNTLGMGVTYLKSDIQKTYYASITGKDGIEYKYPLPKVNKTGIVLKIKEQQEYIIVALNTKDSSPEEYYVKVQSRGVEYDNFYLQFKEGRASGGIEKRMLPEGIIKFTVLNNQDQIVCERLYFNYKEEERINITATPHLKHYSQRDKTILNLNTKDKDSTAIKTNISVLIINKEQLENIQNTSSNIISYFLLNSELRGTIEKPYSYFNLKNKRRKHNMDALMLTQGWSNYKYENSEFNLDFKFLPEKTLTVSGTVRNLLSPNKLLRNPIDLTMIYGPLRVATQKADSTGRFNFQIKDYYKDSFKVMIQSKSEKGKKKDFTIDLDSYKTPKIDYIKEERIQLADSTNIYLEQNIIRKKAEIAFKTSTGTIALDEVELSGYNMTPDREKMMDLHGPPDLVIENDELLTKVKKWHSGLFSLLESSYPNDIEIYEIPPEPVTYKDKIYAQAGISGVVARDYNTDFTFIVIDGIPVISYNYRFLEALPTEEIKSIELIKYPESPRYYENEVFRDKVFLDDEVPADDALFKSFVLDISARVSIISIYTYTGKGFYGARRAKGIYKGLVSGFAPKREFYTPKYENDTFNDWNVPDLRSVVHWEPNLNTDLEGDTKVEFYNADNTGDILIIVEGITENGKFGYYETTYTVEEKLAK